MSASAPQNGDMLVPAWRNHEPFYITGALWAFCEDEWPKREVKWPCETAILADALRTAASQHFEHDINCGLPAPTQLGGDCDCGVEVAYEKIAAALGESD